MGTSLSLPLREQENMEKLFRLLDKQGMQEEKKQVMDLMNYVDGMDEQFGKVLKELQAVKRHLVKLQDGGRGQSMHREVRMLDAKIKAAKAELIDIKNQFMVGIDRAIVELKEKGTLALYQTLDFLKIQKGLIGIKNQLYQATDMANQGIINLGNVGDEIHGVKLHLGNIRRALTGKAAVTGSTREIEKGAVFRMQKILSETMGVLCRLEKRTDRAIQKLDALKDQAKEIQKASVRKKLKTIQARKQEQPDLKVQKRTRAAAR